MLGYQTAYRRWFPLGGEETARTTARTIAFSRALVPAPLIAIVPALVLPHAEFLRYEGVFFTVGLGYIIVGSAGMIWFGTRRPHLVYDRLTGDEGFAA